MPADTGCTRWGLGVEDDKAALVFGVGSMMGHTRFPVADVVIEGTRLLLAVCPLQAHS